MASCSKTFHRACLTMVEQIRTYSARADRAVPANKQKYVPSTGTYPKGFLAGAAHAGVKPSNTKFDDIALVVSEEPCPAQAVTTLNVFKAAPVRVTHAVLKRGSGSHGEAERIRGVVVNSGCANAVTGQDGIAHAESMSLETDKCFGYTGPSDSRENLSTLVMSTGVIGQKLPIDRILPAIPRAHQSLGASHEHWLRAANAICTTDTFPKLISRTFTLPSHPDTTYSIAGMTKGAGMIHPNMATLLGIVCTDVKIEPASMKTLLRHTCNLSFNCISVDGDTSTNDTVAFFANGAAAPAGTKPLRAPRELGAIDTDIEREDAQAFQDVMMEFMKDLAKLVVRDGEGATKFVTIRVQTDRTAKVARRVAVSIARSPLVKTALYGKDANWGRILCAIGYAPGIMYSQELSFKDLEHGHTTTQNFNYVDPKTTSVSFVPADGSEQLKLVTRGEPEQVDEERAKVILEMEDLEILVRLEDDDDKSGAYRRVPKKITEAVYWTCDFSHEYVTINGDYRT